MKSDMTDARATAGSSPSGEPDPLTMTRAELASYLRNRSTVSVPFAGAACDLSRSASYSLARSGDIRAMRLGHRLRVPTTWLERQLGLDGEDEGP